MQQTTLFTVGKFQKNQCSVRVENNGLIVKTPFHRVMVDMIKTLPSTERRFDPNEKSWVVNPRHENLVLSWIDAYFGEQPIVERCAAVSGMPQSSMNILEVHYLATAKDKGGDERIALGMDAGNTWSFVFPESVLRAWFCADTNPTEALTLYGLLGIRQDAAPDAIKAAYRRMALTWHPDHCKEINAADVFLRVKEAYSILSDAGKRGRYDAGLALERSLNRNKQQDTGINDISGYRAPLRCGMILAEGAVNLGRFHVTKILAWEDIINGFGQTLVSSWVYGDKTPTKIWA